MIEVVWFKPDLRIHDHAPLAAAAASGLPVLPLHVLEPGLWALPELAGRHLDFLRESLDDLDAALGRLGARLVLRMGDVVEVLGRIHRAHGIAALRAHEETGLLWTYGRDRAVRAWARREGVAPDVFRGLLGTTPRHRHEAEHTQKTPARRLGLGRLEDHPAPR